MVSRSHALSTALVLAVFGMACALRQPETELALLYNPAAQHHSPDRNPIIAIPGLLGSRLRDIPSGVSVWGAFVRGAADPTSTEGARLIALPVRDGQLAGDEGVIHLVTPPRDAWLDIGFT